MATKKKAAAKKQPVKAAPQKMSFKAVFDRGPFADPGSKQKLEDLRNAIAVAIKGNPEVNKLVSPVQIPEIAPKVVGPEQEWHIDVSVVPPARKGRY